MPEYWNEFRRFNNAFGNGGRSYQSFCAATFARPAAVIVARLIGIEAVFRQRYSNAEAAEKRIAVRRERRAAFVQRGFGFIDGRAEAAILIDRAQVRARVDLVEAS